MNTPPGTLLERIPAVLIDAPNQRRPLHSAIPPVKIALVVGLIRLALEGPGGKIIKISS